jgi:hypothetical protein
MDLMTAANASDIARKNPENVPTIQEKIELLWSHDPSGEPEAQCTLDVDNEPQEGMHGDSILAYLADARSLVEDSTSFRLLLEKAKTALKLTSSSGIMMENVRLETYNALKVPTSKPSFSPVNIECYISWDPAQFLQDQFEIPTDASLCNVITITGSNEEFQAVTCLDYVRQVWPITGEELLLALQDYVHNRLLGTSRSIPPTSGEILFEPFYC